MKSKIKSYAVNDKYLFLIAEEGTRNSLGEAAASTKQLAKIIEDSQWDKVLMDYRKVKFNVNVTDAFNITRYYDQFPIFAKVKIASLINVDTVALAESWLEYSRKRGYNFSFFLDFEQAEGWLMSD